MQRRQSRKNRSRNPRNRQKRGRAVLRMSPPEFTPSPTFGHKFRFANGSNNGTFIITRANMLNLMQVAVTAVTTMRPIEAIKLNLVEVWSNPTALGSPPNVCSVEWVGNQGPSVIHSDSSMGVRAAHVRTRPPKDASERWWSMSNFTETDQLFTLVLPADSVVDVSTSIRLVDNESTIAGDIPAGATPGTFYYDYLDGIASGKLAPVSVAVLP
jgi:hypothetical protein